MAGTTILIRVKKDFFNDIFLKLRKIMAEQNMIDEEQISFPQISTELRRRILNQGGIKEK